ncbi:hypothetical protein [Acinetobacter stercoris]|uniref:Uncharacterized protein n=1 Tax=Acinetobacter stercoris TaxID=2126983 RepID=A0A2U3MUQ0_9GAMM|nr:hypothetical protein [Acinetobacter stercoris]SPL69151.1 hypothetical protein KPC_0329 [Acinetobacter stercoris]
MLTIDDQNLINQAIHTEGIYHASVREKCINIQKILLDGVVVHGVLFCDVNRSYLIKNKETLDGRLVATADGAVIQEMLMGNVEVILNGMEQ